MNKPKYTVSYSNQQWIVYNNESESIIKIFNGTFNDATAKRRAQEWANEMTRCNP